MESIGEKLRTMREEKSLSIDQVARDTNIAKRYIAALEDEAFSEFPGEPYLVGFLRNYADYLGLDAEEIVGLYKNFKIQEQPVPMEELLEPKRSAPKAAILIIAVVIVAIVVAGIFLFPTVSGGKSSAAVQQASVKTAGATQYQLTDEVVERRFVSGDTVVIPVGTKTYKIQLTVQGKELLLTYADGQTTVKVGEEKSIDLNGDSTPDVKVFLRDIDTRDPAKGVIVRFDRFMQSPNGPPAPPAVAGKEGGQTPAAGTAPQTAAASAAQPAAVQPAQAPAPATPAPPQPAPVPQTPAPVAQAAAPAVQPAAPAAGQPVPTIVPQEGGGASAGPVVILQAANPSPFSLTINFTGYCLFRSAVDGAAQEQRYFQKGETTQLEVGKSVEVWASNGGAMSARISGTNVDFGTPGEISARKIQWVRNNSTGGYELQMTRMQ